MNDDPYAEFSQSFESTVSLKVWSTSLIAGQQDGAKEEKEKGQPVNLSVGTKVKALEADKLAAHVEVVDGLLQGEDRLRQKPLHWLG